MTYTVKVSSEEGKWLGYITIEPGPVKRGELAAARREDGMLTIGKLVGVGRHHVTLEACGTKRRTRCPVALGVVVEVTRAEDVALDDATPAATKIEVLRARLEQLDGPEDEAARFRLLREIYDLEHAAPDEDEWPEYIGGEGRRAA